MNKKIIILVSSTILLFALVTLLKVGNIGTNALWNISNEGKALLPLVSVSALIDSINPCAFGILLLTIGFLLSLGKDKWGILKIGSVYIFGLFTVYLLIGLGILQALHIFNTPHFMAKVGAALLITMGAINIINDFFPSFPIKLKIPSVAHQKIATLLNKASLPATFLLGVLVGMCEFPCTGGPYLMVLGLLHDGETYFRGVLYLLLYNLIFILPLVLILFIASTKELAEKVNTWKKKETGNMKFWGSLAMILLGLLMLML